MAIRAGFIGLGNQGKPIAAHFAPSGFETIVYDINPGPVSYKLAEAVLGLGLAQSRQYYKPPIVRVDDRLRAMLDGAVEEQSKGQ